MADLLPVFKDVHFWIGLLLFTASIIGIAWILKSLHNTSAGELTGLIQEPPPPRKPPAETADASKTQSVPALPAPEPPRVTLESLAERLARIEEMLAQMSAQSRENGRAEISGELKAMAQAMKAGPPAQSSVQMQQLSAKVDQILQVLSSLAGTE